MKKIINNYPKEILEQAFEKYQALKKDPDYLGRLLPILYCERTYSSIRESDYITDKEQPLLAEYARELQKLNKLLADKYQLIRPISPSLNLRQKDLYQPTITPSSPLALVIFAFGIDDNPRLLSPKDYRKPRVRKEVPPLTLKEKKYFCYIWNTKARIAKRKSLRSLGNLFKCDHKTVGNWIDEVRQWPETEKEAVANEIIRSKPLPNKDMMSMTRSITKFDDIMHIYGDEGFFDDGQKRTASYSQDPVSEA
jgi:hypothetical protein